MVFFQSQTKVRLKIAMTNPEKIGHLQNLLCEVSPKV